MIGNTLSRYKLLDSFRGLAILWIVCFHVLVNVREQYGSILNYIISHGNLGVTVFFVISGYGIADTISKNIYYSSQPHLFLLRRLRRIYSCYWWYLLFAALIIPFLSAVVSMIKSHTFNVHFVHFSTFEWFQIATLIKVFSSSSWKLNLSFLPLNGAVWYIAVIVQIYTFVTFCLYIKRYYSFFLFIGFVASLLTYISAVKELLPYGLFLPYFCQFYIGMIIHSLLRMNLYPKSNLIQIIILLLMIGILYYCAINENEFFSFSFAIFTGLVFLIVSRYDSVTQSWPPVKLFYIAGNFSYSLYLLHIPLWPFVDMFVRNLIPLSPKLSGPLILVPGIVITSFIWYLFFEKPLTQRNVIDCVLSPIDTIYEGLNFVINAFKRRKSNNSINSDM